MNYLECLAYIDSLSPTLEKPSLTRISAFLAEHSNWQNQYKVIHVGGTNGKGSTVAILDSIIRQTGLRVGRFTGPHLLRWNERFHVDGDAIEDHRFAELASLVRQQSEEFGRSHADLGPLTWFEYLTAIAFCWFAQEKIDVAVVEVGLGGRFDATNVVENVLTSVITNIALDHTHILGNTIEAIAFEKAGIIKPHVPVVTGADGTAYEVIAQRCAELRCDLYKCFHGHGSFAMGARPGALSEARRYLQSCDPFPIIWGRYQKMNALIAVAAFLMSGLTDRRRNRQAKLQQFITRGMASAYWPGRLQPVAARKLILDGAHNPAGAAALRMTLDELFSGRQFRFVISCFENKNGKEMVEALVRPGDQVYFSEASTRRATYNKEELTQYCQSQGIGANSYATVKDAFAQAEVDRTGFEIIVATGSFATVREVMLAMGWKSVEDGMSECVKITSGRADSLIEE